MVRRSAGDRYGRWGIALQRLCVIVLALGAATVTRAQSPQPAAVPGGPGRTVKLVAFGDSLTAGYGLPASAAFPAVLQAELRKRGHDVEILNAGVSGDTTTGGLARLDWSVPDGTDGVIVELGANDMLRGTPPAVPRKALDTIVSRLKARGMAVMMTGMFAAPNLGPDYVKAFEGIYPDLAARHGLVLYPFFLDGVTGAAPSLALPDGLHPSAEGVRVIVSRILPSVETFLARLKPAE